MGNVKSCIQPPKRSSTRNDNVPFLAVPTPQAQRQQLGWSGSPSRSEPLPRLATALGSELTHATLACRRCRQRPGASPRPSGLQPPQLPLNSNKSSTTTLARPRWLPLTGNPSAPYVCPQAQLKCLILQAWTAALAHERRYRVKDLSAHLLQMAEITQGKLPVRAGHWMELCALLKFRLTYHWIWAQEIPRIAKNLRTGLQIRLQN